MVWPVALSTFQTTHISVCLSLVSTFSIVASFITSSVDWACGTSLCIWVGFWVAGILSGAVLVGASAVSGASGPALVAAGVSSGFVTASLPESTSLIFPSSAGVAISLALILASLVSFFFLGIIFDGSPAAIALAISISAFIDLTPSASSFVFLRAVSEGSKSMPPCIARFLRSPRSRPCSAINLSTLFEMPFASVRPECPSLSGFAQSCTAIAAVRPLSVRTP